MSVGQNFCARFAKLKFRGQVAKREGPELSHGDPPNRKAVEKAGSAETGVRGRRYQNTRLIYVGFVGEGIRSNTFTDGHFRVLQFSVTICSWGVFWRPAGDGKAVQNGGWAYQKSIELIKEIDLIEIHEIW